MILEKKFVNRLIDTKIREIERKIEIAYNNGDETYCLYEIIKAFEDFKDDINGY